MNFKTILIPILSLFAISSCNVDHIDDNKKVETTPELSGDGVSLYVSTSADSKTAIDPTDYASVKWSIDDKLYLWAKNESSDLYELQNQEFSLRYLYEDGSKALFIGDIDTLVGESYTYFAAYPKPASVNGTVVTQALSAAQTGSYDGSSDLMSATPVEAVSGLTYKPSKEFTLGFKHLTHIFRLEVPTGRDLMGEINRVSVTFPSNVVGSVVYDAASAPFVTSLENGSNKVAIELDSPLEEGQYLWLFVHPTTISGNVSFEFSNPYGITKTLNASIDKECLAGAITPIKLTVPKVTENEKLTAGMPVNIPLKISTNNLGEDIENITVKAPANATFLDGTTSKTMAYDSENGVVISFTGVDNAALFKSKGLTISYESESALLQNKNVSLSECTWYDEKSVSLTVPYLYEQPFASTSNTGWSLTGDNAKFNTNVNFQIGCYGSKKFAGSTSYSNSRANSPKITALKNGKTVKVSFTFDCRWDGDSDALQVSAGRSTSTAVGGAINGGATKTPQTTSKPLSYEVSGYTNSQYLSIETANCSYSFKWYGGSGTTYLYIDNIKVKIVK